MRRRRPRIVRLAAGAILAQAMLVTLTPAADWPQWRGPERSGVVEKSPPLAGSWPEEGPPLIWRIEEIPSGGEGGYSSPVVADGLVYLYVNQRYRVPLETRTLSDSGLRRLDWIPETLPDRLEADIEKARLSTERGELSGSELREWVDRWIEERLDEEQARRFGSYVRRRLHAGDDALSVEILRELEEIRGHEFESEEALLTWIRRLELDEKERKKILSVIPTDESRTKDVVICADAATGRTRWRMEEEGRGSGASSTLCLKDGRCYGLNSLREAFCLDARTGREIWKTPCGGGHSSFLVIGRRAIVAADELTALGAGSGEVLWKQDQVRSRENSVTPWKRGERTLLVCNTSRQVACVEPEKGAILWTVPGGGPSTAAVDGEYLAILTNQDDVGLLAYRISEEGARKLWNLPELTDRGASPILHGGHVFAVTGRKTVCVNVESGEIAWESKDVRGDICSPVLADGKLIAVHRGNREISLLSASPDAYRALASCRLSLAPCASPALAGQRLYLRVSDGLVCYDLAPQPATRGSP